MQDNLIPAQHQDPPLDQRVEPPQQAPRLAARLRHSAPRRRPTRGRAGRHHNGQQRDDLSQTQAHGSARGRKRALLGLRYLLSRSPGVPQRLITDAARLRVHHRLLHTLGMVGYRCAA